SGVESGLFGCALSRHKREQWPLPWLFGVGTPVFYRGWPKHSTRSKAKSKRKGWPQTVTGGAIFQLCVYVHRW
uniref:Uncharacterized protein n=1 Tax=Anopheles quadriannulatus TaxID=34691 RepID=A0A182XSI1_ANOQN